MGHKPYEFKLEGTNDNKLEDGCFYIDEGTTLVFWEAPDTYRINNPEEIIRDGKRIKSELIEEINLRLEKGAKRDDIIRYGVVGAFELNRKFEYYKTSQITLETGTPFMATEQHRLRFDFFKDDRAYEIFIGTDGSESTIAAFYKKHKDVSFIIGRFRNVKITLDRNNYPGHLIVNIWGKTPESIVGYARLAQEEYMPIKDAEGEIRGAFWKNAIKSIPPGSIASIAETQSSFTTGEIKPSIINSRWYVPRRYCKVLKRIFELKSRGEDESTLAKIYAHSKTISLILGAIGLIGPRAGQIMFVLGAVFNALEPEKMYYNMIKRLEEVTGYSFDIESGDNYKNGCYFQEITRAHLRYLENGQPYLDEETYFELYPWIDTSQITSPEGEFGNWTDGIEYMDELMNETMKQTS